MSIYISVDSGTTNTRIALVKDNKIIKTLKYNVGASKSIGDGTLLKNALKEGISKLLAENNLTEKNVTKIIASGMITSEFGLVGIPHLELPVGKEDLSKNLFEKSFPEISSVPFTFVRGIKSFDGNFENTDMVRGEETEIMGILKGEGIYLLAGSHTKLISVDKEEKIVAVKTLLTGELIAAVSGNTILKDAIDLSASGLTEEYLLAGYNYAAEKGIGDALFKVRILKNLFNKTSSEVYSFFMGAILSDDINAVLNSGINRVVISGTKYIRTPIAIILRKISNLNITEISETESEQATVRGQINIIEEI